MKGTGQSPRFRNSPENRLGPPKPKQLEQQSAVGRQLDDGAPKEQQVVEKPTTPPKSATGSGDADFGIPTRPMPILRGW